MNVVLPAADQAPSVLNQDMQEQRAHGDRSIQNN